MTKPCTPIDLGQPKPKGRHGGRRPGAGAPKGNMNAVRHGLRSQRFWRAAFMIAAVPELRDLIRAMQTEDLRKGKEQYKRIFAAALYASQQDPDLAQSIKKMVYKRLREATSQIRLKSVLLEMLADNRTIKPLLNDNEEPTEEDQDPT